MNLRLSGPKILIFVLVSLLLFYLGRLPWNPYSPLTWWLAPRSEIEVLIPKDYLGPILIAYEIPDGEIAEKKDAVWIYRLHADGALLLQNERPTVVLRMSFLYEDDNGSWQPLNQAGCYKEAVVDTISICGGGAYEIFNAKELHPHHLFTVIAIKKGERWDRDGSDILIRKYLDRLQVSDAE